MHYIHMLYWLKTGFIPDRSMNLTNLFAVSRGILSVLLSKNAEFSVFVYKAEFCDIVRFHPMQICQLHINLRKCVCTVDISR